MNDKIFIEDMGVMFIGKSTDRKRRAYKIECPTCAEQRIVSKSNYISYDTTHCNKCKVKTHGGSKDKLYAVWKQMKQRCYNSKSQNYKHYGAKGITIQSNWKESYEEFKSWALNNGYEDTLSIDRIDPYKGYSEDNCRWADAETQANNKRTLQANNTSNYRCVRFDKRRNKWYSSIIIKGESKFLGYTDTAVESAINYNTYVTANNLNKKLNIIKA